MQNFVYGLKPCNPETLKSFYQYKNHPFASRQPKPVLDRRGINFTPDVDGNNDLPDCTAVQMANSIKAFSTLYAGVGYSTPLISVLTLYANTVGCPITIEAIKQTNGAVYADIVKTACSAGIAVAPQLEAVPDVALLDNSVTQLANATDLYGCASIGIRLYDKDEQTIASGGLLDADGSDPGTLQGRHMTMTWDYSGFAETNTWRINLWGVLYPVTLRWIQARIDESWAQMWRNLMDPATVAQFADLMAESQFSWRA